MKIGKYKISVIKTAFFSLDGGAIFGIIPKPLWSKVVDADDRNRVKLGSNCLLLESETKKILIDTGIGSGWDEKFKKIYGLDYSTTLEENLASSMILPEDITDVIFTHLHFDHTGGAVNYGDGKIIPMFPNAKYHVQKNHFEWAKNPSPKDRGSFIESRFLPLASEGVLNFIEGDFQYDDEIVLETFNGHTIDQQLVKVSDESTILFHTGDLMPLAAHIPIPYIMGYDIQPLITAEEKIRVLSQAVDEDWYLFFEHDIDTLLAKVSKNEKGYLIKVRFTDLV